MILIHKNKSFFFRNLNHNPNLRKNFKCILLSQTKIFIKKKIYKNKIKIGLTKILNRRLFLKRYRKRRRINKNKKNNKNNKNNKILVKINKKKSLSYKYFFFYLRRNKMKSSPRTLISKFKNFFIKCVYKKKKIFFFKF